MMKNDPLQQQEQYVSCVLLNILLNVQLTLEEFRSEIPHDAFAGAGRIRGICKWVAIEASRKHSAVSSMVINKFKCLNAYEAPKWEMFSGNREYPVPSPVPALLSPEAAYEVLDHWSGPYGDLRKKYLQFLIALLKKELGWEE